MKLLIFVSSDFIKKNNFQAFLFQMGQHHPKAKSLTVCKDATKAIIDREILSCKKGDIVMSWNGEQFSKSIITCD